MGTNKLIIGLFILLIAEIVPIKGKWIFDLDLKSYSNPKHARLFDSDKYCCCDCPISGDCCLNDLSSLNFCTDRDCNNRFLICFSDASSEPGTCVNSDTVRDDDSITFSSGLTKGGINNPIQYDGEGEGTLTVTIYVYDNVVASGNTDFRQNYIDLIEETFQFGITDGITSGTTYNGVNGIISMEFGYGIRCAEGYSGNDCSTPPEDCPSCNTTATQCPVCTECPEDCPSCNTTATQCPVCTECPVVDCNTTVTECPVCLVSTSVAVATSLPTPTTSQIAPIGVTDVAATPSTTSSKSSSEPIATLPPTTSTTATSPESPDQNNEDIIVNINNENITVNVNTSLIVSSILEALRESTSQFSSESDDGDEDNDGLLPTVVAAIVFFNLFMNVIIIIAVIIVLICLLKVKQDGLGLSVRNNAYELKGSVH